MANYYGRCRTNYFSVLDEAKFKKFMSKCIGDEDIAVCDRKQNDGSTKFCFYCDGCISGLPYKLVNGEPVVTFDEDEVEEDLDNDICWDLFCKALQEVLPDGEAVIITEVGSEKLVYLVGHSLVITKNALQGIEIQKKAIELARIMLGNPGYTTQMDN